MGGPISIGNATTAVSFPMEMEQVEMETPTALLHRGRFISVGNETTAVSFPLEMVHSQGNETTAVSFPMEMGRSGNGTTHRASPTELSKSENVENGAG